MVSAKRISGGDLYTAESNFKQDFDGDGTIGEAITYTTTESKGSVSLLKDSVNNLSLIHI